MCENNVDDELHAMWKYPLYVDIWETLFEDAYPNNLVFSSFSGTKSVFL